MSAEHQRKAYRYNCNMVRPQLYSEKSLMESVVDFFSDVVPQAYTTHKVEDKEKIQWVRFENCDCSDIARNPDLYKYDAKGLPLLLILGYSNGVQIWNITPNGEALEILSVRQGPVKICRILPNPEPGYTDSFTSKRPLVVMCDSSSAGQPFCGMKFVSLKTGDEVHSTSFKNLPIHNIECNKRFLVVTFLEKICIYESSRFKQLFWITSCFPSTAPNVNPIALSSRWLAYADKRLVAMHQSCGGMSGDGTQSYAATVISAAKGAFKGLSMFGEAMVNSMTGCKPPGTKKPQEHVQLDNGNRPGIISVVDIQNVHNDHFNVNEDNEGSGLIAHFHAHANEPVADMAFDPTGTLLVTACKLGHNFHIFRLMAHPCSSSLGAVHHLYTLHRGDTTAKVIDIGFNHDSRWVTVSTHRGTTHIFPITPYGGIPNVRTHCQPFVVNRASRFHRSAGLEDIDHSPLGRRSPVLSTSPSSSGHYDRYPTLIQQNTLNNNMGNPRLPPYPHPITVYPLYQIKQPLNVVLNPGNKNMSPNHSPTGFDNIYSVTSKFCTPRLCVVGSPKLDVERRETGKRPVDCLFIMAQSGTLVEYVLEPKARAVSERVNDESLLELNVAGRMQWNLQRLKTSNELRPPLPSNSPLILSHEAVISQTPTPPEYYDLPGLTRHDSKDSLSSDHSGKDEDEWVSQVEIITHAGPHRRLWMGPQFSFKTYQENTTVLSSNSSALLSQSTETNMVAMDITGEEGDLESLRVQPTRSNPVSMPNARPAYRRLSSDSSPSPGLSGHSAPLLIEAGSFDQSPHLLDVYSNWTESTVEKQPRGSDDMEEDRIKETLADAMVESPMRDMEKLSLRQDLSRANRGKVTADSNLKKDPAKKETSSSAASGNKDSKAGTQIEVKKSKGSRVPEKSSSNLVNSPDKGRKISLDKSLTDSKPTSVIKSSASTMESKHLQDGKPGTSKSSSKVASSEGKPQNKQKALEKEETPRHEKQQDSLKLMTKENGSQREQKSIEKLSSNKVSADASLTDIRTKTNSKAGKKKNKSKIDSKESCSKAVIVENTATDLSNQNQYSLEDDVPVVVEDSTFDMKGTVIGDISCEDVSGAAGLSSDTSTIGTDDSYKILSNKNSLPNKPIEDMEEQNIKIENVADAPIDTHISKTSATPEPKQANAKEVSEDNITKPDLSYKTEAKAQESDIARRENSPEKAEIQIGSSKKQRRGKDKKKTQNSPSTDSNGASSSKETFKETKLQNKSEEDISNNHKDTAVVDVKDKEGMLNSTHVENSQQTPDAVVVKESKGARIPVQDKEQSISEGFAGMNISYTAGEDMQTSLSWQKPDKKKKKGRKNEKGLGQHKMVESITESSEILSLDENQRCNDKTESSDDIKEGNEVNEFYTKICDLKVENDIENKELKTLDISQVDNLCNSIYDDSKKTVNEDIESSLYHGDGASVELDISMHDRNQKPFVEEKVFENIGETDVKGKSKQKKKKKGSKKEVNEELNEFDTENNQKVFNEKTRNDGKTGKASLHKHIEQQDTDILTEQAAEDGDTGLVNSAVPEVVDAIYTEGEYAGPGAILNIDGLDLDSGFTDGVERSPSFESARSTFSEDRLLPKNEGTDSEVLGSTEQSDNDMIEVTSKKKKKKKKIDLEESMYFEAVESEFQLCEEIKDPELETTIPDIAVVKLDTLMDRKEITCSDQKVTSKDSCSTYDLLQGTIGNDNQDNDNEMLVVKSKKKKKNKTGNGLNSSNPGTQDCAIEADTASLMPTFPTEEISTEDSLDLTPVNSGMVEMAIPKQIELKVNEEDAMAWETAGNLPLDESQINIRNERDGTSKAVPDSEEERHNDDKSNDKDDEFKHEIINDDDDSLGAVKQEEGPIEPPESSTSSSRSSEEKEVGTNKPKKTHEETKTKKKRKKNKK